MTVRTDATDREPRRLSARDVELELEAYRRELTGYCYRMLGSGSEAEDAVQETLLRAWRAADDFEGRSSVRSWLYRIATNVCLDMLRGPQRRARPMDLGPSTTAHAILGAPVADAVWVQPIANALVLDDHADPADLAVARDSVRLAFIAALQYLPPRQRAVLILREVLRWPASEVAALLDTTVVSINSALQRARTTLAATDLHASPRPIDPGQQVLLEQYIDAFERYDVESLVELLHEDATFSMPPYAMWLQGPVEVSRWLLGQGIECRGSRALATAANGGAALGTYRPAEPGLHLPFALVVMETHHGRISGLHHFLNPDLFASFGLPSELRG